MPLENFKFLELHHFVTFSTFCTLSVPISVTPPYHAQRDPHKKFQTLVIVGRSKTMLQHFEPFSTFRTLKVQSFEKPVISQPSTKRAAALENFEILDSFNRLISHTKVNSMQNFKIRAN